MNSTLRAQQYMYRCSYMWSDASQRSVQSYSATKNLFMELWLTCLPIVDDPTPPHPCPSRSCTPPWRKCSRVCSAWPVSSSQRRRVWQRSFKLMTASFVSWTATRRLWENPQVVVSESSILCKFLVPGFSLEIYFQMVHSTVGRYEMPLYT